MLAQTLAKLSERDKSLLMMALEQGSMHIIRLDEDFCIAVNAENNKEVIPIETKGHWIYGKLSQGTSGRYERRADGYE